MKRIKIMLTAIAVLAVVGGALAFKAQKFDLKKICIGTGPEKLNCQILNTDWRTTFDSPTFSYYTTVTDGAVDCSGVVSCPTQTYLTSENPL